MRREPDQKLRPDPLAHAGDRLVVLPYVHAVRAGRDRQIGPVVQDEERAVLRTQSAKGCGGGQDLIVRRILLAQLEHVHTARECLAESVLFGARIGDEIEARAGESRLGGRHALNVDD